MRDDTLDRLVSDAVEHHRPTDPPPFEALAARWRRRRRIRRGAVAAAVVVAAAVAVPVALTGRAGGPDPDAAATSASPSAGRPFGRIPFEVTGVSACRATDCRTISDPAQVRLLVDDLNSARPHPNTGDDPYLASCEPDPVGVTLTFSGPRGPYPVVDAMIKCSWWKVRGEEPRYVGGNGLESAHQAQALGVVVHDCGITSPYLEPDRFAPQYLGLTLEEARSLAGQTGAEVRVLGQDADCADMITDDRRLSRINLYVHGGRVTSAAFF